ncbi:NAD(P)-dependent dehydrogenase (short-subunit alcohol dehydrogenase family) [Algoriphagus boseongensis]|uniref:NAD(P)-dependent dehydrogenase (Short-subunit alcohol dehydrogenase family) n=1 Tax=Algoriphagus boseongensis TaxID=1442587 RepID=A0A4R6T2N0_9BACT|nr:SDR family oxidoreductase [Algoriphagus boseongensis]TDQ14684.1 NAD(P)-dependent dehydrogenase (short-subunit alcohol dehydrogenase family) [Algoriphagus boseongensis]
MKTQKVAIVTGAGQGIGLEIARKLLEEGSNVVLNDLEKSLTEEAVANLSRMGKGSVLGCSGDAADQSVIDELIELALSNFGRLDQVVCNAGITLFGNFLDYSQADFLEVVRVNQAGTFFLTQAAARVMKNQAEGGAILFTSSVTAHQSHENLAAYAMSKAAIEMLAKNLVLELAPLGIRINTIAPGATLTERTTSDPEYAGTWSRLTPMGRPASATDIANAAAFLLSDSARHITGQTLIIDGGWTSISPSPYA